MLQHAGLADNNKRPTKTMHDPDTKLILLGDLVHAKSRQRYSALAGVRRYDEHNSKHLANVEAAQEAILWDIKNFASAVPEGQVTILMGNHDYNIITPKQGALRSDNVAHLEWHGQTGNSLDAELCQWITSWPYEKVIEGIHFAHVGPLPEHNLTTRGFISRTVAGGFTKIKTFLKTPTTASVSTAILRCAVVSIWRLEVEPFCSILTATATKPVISLWTSNNATTTSACKVYFLTNLFPAEH
jgi:hypothetical protein